MADQDRSDFHIHELALNGFIELHIKLETCVTSNGKAINIFDNLSEERFIIKTARKSGRSWSAICA